MGVFVGSDSGQNRATGVIDSHQQADSASYPKEKLPFGPLGSIKRRIGSLPLSAKIGIAIVPMLFAWPLIFRALDRFDGFDVGRNRWRALLLALLGLLLFGCAGTFWEIACP